MDWADAQRCSNSSSLPTRQFHGRRTFFVLSTRALTTSTFAAIAFEASVCVWPCQTTVARQSSQVVTGQRCKGPSDARNGVSTWLFKVWIWPDSSFETLSM
eukprot:COSAG04_NODE_657_length_11477_cov_17.225962_12_plen_101_part_00